MRNIKNDKMLKQIVSQLEQMCLKLGIKTGYTLTISNFKRQFVPWKWPGTGKGATTKELKISCWDTKIYFLLALTFSPRLSTNTELVS